MVVRPRVSVIIVNYNAGEYLSACVSSVLSQVDEVIVVDNCSTDSSAEACAMAHQEEAKLNVIRNRRNLGFATACNIGANAANGTYVLFLNPDCYVTEGAVAQMVETLGWDDSVGAVGALVLNPDGTEQAGARRAIPTPWRSFVRVFGLTRFADRWPNLFVDFNLNMQTIPEQPIEVEAVSGACIMMKSQVLKEINGWDEEYFLHCEDLDICMRLRGHGWIILFVPTARVIHERAICSRGRLVFVEWHKHKGMVRFYRKFFRHQYPGVLMWIVVVGVWVRFSVIVADHLLQQAKRLTDFADA